MQISSRRWIGSLAAIVLGGTALAQLQTIPQFTGAASEGFEGTQALFTPCLPYRVFNNQGDLCTPGNSSCHTTTGWSYICTIYANAGSWFYGSTGGTTEIAFDNPVSRFGGMFGTNSGVPNATFDFYDVNGLLISSEHGGYAADCAWHWLGWQSTTPIKRVLVTGATSGGGYAFMDELQIDFAQIGPVTYCTSGTTTHNCVPAISGTGTPSASATSGFTVAVSSVEGQKQGLLFYGVNQTGFSPVPWGPSSSWLCVKAPTQRMGVQQTGGTLNLCNGTLSIDWNAFRAANPSALGSPFSAGQVIYAQGWFRDPPSPKNTMLSNGLQFTLQP
jgi:hypothetical protein